MRFERAKSLRSAEDGRADSPSPYFSDRFSANLPTFGKFSALARDRREISQKFRRNRDQRPEFALDLGFGQKVFPNPLSRLFGHLSHRLGKGPEQDPGKSGRKMKNFSSRPGKAARPLQTYSLKELVAASLLDVRSRKSGVCAARTGRVQNVKINMISLLLAVLAVFADHLPVKFRKFGSDAARPEAGSGAKGARSGAFGAV